MNFNYRKPLVTHISSVMDIRNTKTCVLNWCVPADFTNALGTSDVQGIVGFKLYRHIEKITPVTTGGVLVNPEVYDTTPLSANAPKWKLVQQFAVQPNQTLFYYTDTFADLYLHSDEGIALYGTTWRDSAGNDVINDIEYTRRRLYYKIEATSDRLTFNNLPFIYLAHENGVECRSIITQCIGNVLYHEGETVWYNNTLSSLQRVAVDVIYDGSAQRRMNVWASGSSKQVYCLDGKNGEIIKSFTLPVANNLGVRVDPSTGNGIVVGDSNTIYRCVQTTGAIRSECVATGAKSAQNVGIVITKENGQYYTYLDTNKEFIVKSTIGNTSNSSFVYDKTNFGANISTPDIPNVLGVTNGPGNTVWVNGHVPADYSYSSEVTVHIPYSYWNNCCIPYGDGTVANVSTLCFNAYKANGNKGTPVCDKNRPNHFYTGYTTSTYTATVNNPFLQDIGYVYGIGPGNFRATNGQPYSSSYVLGYPPGSVYQPFTRRDRALGWRGDLQGTGTSPECNFPYTGTAGQDPTTVPNPPESQLGLTTDFGVSGILTTGTYNVWQTNNVENTIHRLTYSDGVLSYNNSQGLSNDTQGIQGADWWSVSSPTHAATDSQGNTWVVCNSGSNQLALIYHLDSSEVFPHGGNCRWPTTTYNNISSGITPNYIYGAPRNNAYIEYMLTRDVSFAPYVTAVCDITDGNYLNGYGTRLSGSFIVQSIYAYNWCLSNYSLSGRKIYSNYNDAELPVLFAKSSLTNNSVIEYNSDNIGNCFICTEQQVYLTPTFAHPSPVLPTLTLNVSGVGCIDRGCDGTFWNNQIINTGTATSGYDDFAVILNGAANPGGYTLSNYTFYTGDTPLDYGGDANTIIDTRGNTVLNYIYHTPTKNGKPGYRTNSPKFSTGVATAYYTASTAGINCYAFIGSTDSYTVGATSNMVSATVFERWPTANFWVEGHSPSAINQQYLAPYWLLTAYNFPTSTASGTYLDDTQVIIGYDPVSAVFVDYTASRTWAASSWDWSYGDANSFAGFSLQTPQISISALGLINYPHTITDVITARSPAASPDDCTTAAVMSSHLYKGPGIYYATLFARASNSGTESMAISSGVIDQSQMDWSKYATREVRVLEMAPSVVFNVISGETVPSNYSDTDSYIAPSVAATTWNSSGMTFISGYAPTLSVRITGAIAERSLPISAMSWDLGDPYNESDYANYTVALGPLLSGWPVWHGAKNNHSVIDHTFIMPGLYNISLRGAVSSVNVPQEVRAEDTAQNIQNMVVQVAEILPYPIFAFSNTLTSGFNTSTVTAMYSSNLYFNASGSIPGSFSISRLDWDFGDGSDIVTITRYGSAATLYYNQRAFSDLTDPRNYIIGHDYKRINSIMPSSIFVSMSAYASNTNTCVATALPVVNLSLPTISYKEGELRIIASRSYDSDNNVYLVLEGSKSRDVFNVVLSTKGF